MRSQPPGALRAVAIPRHAREPRRSRRVWCRKCSGRPPTVGRRIALEWCWKGSSLIECTRDLFRPLRQTVRESQEAPAGDQSGPLKSRLVEGLLGVGESLSGLISSPLEGRSRSVLSQQLRNCLTLLVSPDPSRRRTADRRRSAKVPAGSGILTLSTRRKSSPGGHSRGERYQHGPGEGGRRRGAGRGPCWPARLGLFR